MHIHAKVKCRESAESLLSETIGLVSIERTVQKLQWFENTLQKPVGLWVSGIKMQFYIRTLEGAERDGGTEQCFGGRRRISQRELPVVKLTPAQHVCRLCSRFKEDYCVFVYLLPRLTAASLPQVSKHALQWMCTAHLTVQAVVRSFAHQDAGHCVYTVALGCRLMDANASWLG